MRIAISSIDKLAKQKLIQHESTRQSILDRVIRDYPGDRATVVTNSAYCDDKFR